MLVVYPAIFHKDDGSIWVEFPDLEGCFTDGETIEEAIENASDALGLYIYTRFEKGWKTPKQMCIRDSLYIFLVSISYVHTSVS